MSASVCLAVLVLASTTMTFTANGRVRGVSAEAEYEAIQQALGRALRDAMGTWLLREGEWAAALERDVFARRGKYVSEYAVVSGRDSRDATVLERTVRVEVEMDALAATLVDLGILYYPAGRDTACVVVGASGGLRGAVERKLLGWLHRWGVSGRTLDAGSSEDLAAITARARGARWLLLVRQVVRPGEPDVLEGMILSTAEQSLLSRGSARGEPDEAVAGLVDSWSWRPPVRAEPTRCLPLSLVVEGFDRSEADGYLNKVIGIPGVAAVVGLFETRASPTASVLWCGSVSSFEEAVREVLGRGVGVLTEGQTVRVFKEGAVPERVVSVVSFRVEELFPACLRYYLQEPPASVRLVNRGHPVDAMWIQADAPGFTTVPSRTRWEGLVSGQEVEQRVRIPLDPDKVLGVTQDLPVEAEVVVTYNGTEARATAAAVIHRRTAVDWARIRSVCAFVNPREEAVAVVGSRAASLDGAAHPLPGNVETGMKVWTYVGSLGLQYRPDPGVAKGEVYDDVHFPTETLGRGGGDCEDLSVLLASSLEAVGVPSMLLVTQDHVLLAFDTGLTEKNGVLLSLTREDYLVKDDHVWVPLESTVLGADFLTSWEQGAGRCRETINRGGTMEMIVVEEGWKEYPPISPSFALVDARLLPVTEALRKDWNSVQASFRERWEAQVEVELHRLMAGVETAPVRSVNARGVLLARAGRLDEAEQAFSQAQRESWAMNNLANVLLLKGNAADAVKQYKNALELSDDEGVWANLALAYYAMADEEGDSLARETLAHAVARAGGEAPVRRIMGIGVFEVAADAKAAPAKKVSQEDILHLLAAAREQIPETVAERPRAVHLLAARKALGASELHDLALYLYWKEPPA